MKPAVFYHVPELPFARLRFSLAAGQPCFLPRFKGSLLRGAFGYALRRTICVMPSKQPCETCLLKQQCIYPRIFETFVNDDPPPFLRGLPTAPRPYVFEPFDATREYYEGDSLQFDLILLGQSVELYPYVIYAVDRMAHTGLGRRRHPFNWN